MKKLIKFSNSISLNSISVLNKNNMVLFGCVERVKESQNENLNQVIQAASPSKLKMMLNIG